MKNHWCELNIIKKRIDKQNPLIIRQFYPRLSIREINVRWFWGSVLMGMASLILMYCAFYTTLNRQKQIIERATFFKRNSIHFRSEKKYKKRGNRIIELLEVNPFKKKFFMFQYKYKNVMKNRVIPLKNVFLHMFLHH